MNGRGLVMLMLRWKITRAVMWESAQACLAFVMRNGKGKGKSPTLHEPCMTPGEGQRCCQVYSVARALLRAQGVGRETKFGLQLSPCQGRSVP